MQVGLIAKILNLKFLIGLFYVSHINMVSFRLRVLNARDIHVSFFTLCKLPSKTGGRIPSFSLLSSLQSLHSQNRPHHHKLLQAHSSVSNSHEQRQKLQETPSPIDTNAAAAAASQAPSHHGRGRSRRRRLPRRNPHRRLRQRGVAYSPRHGESPGPRFPPR